MKIKDILEAVAVKHPIRGGAYLSVGQIPGNKWEVMYTAKNATSDKWFSGEAALSGSRKVPQWRSVSVHNSEKEAEAEMKSLAKQYGYKIHSYKMKEDADVEEAEILDEAVVVDTDAYETEYKHAPKGRAGWIFAKKLRTEMTPEGKNKEWFQYQGTYQDAKKAALAWAKKQGLSSIVVMI